MKTIATLIAAVLLGFGIATPAHADDRLNVVTAGDSITHGDGAAKHWSYPDQLGRMYRDDLKVTNLAHSSSCLITQGCGYGETLTDTFDREILALHPDVVIISIGRNDLCHVSAYRYKTALRALRDAAQEQGARVLYGTITPANERWQWPCEDQAAELNKWMLKRPGTIDFASAVADRHGALRKAYDYGDGLHQNGAGYRAMARAAGVTLSALIN